MSERNQPIDTLTLGDYLKTKNELEAVGGLAYLCTLAEFVPTAVNVLSYAKIVKRESQFRSLISLFMEAAERGYTGNDDPLLLASDVCAELLRIDPTSPAARLADRRLDDSLLEGSGQRLSEQGPNHRHSNRLGRARTILRRYFQRRFDRGGRPDKPRQNRLWRAR